MPPASADNGKGIPPRNTGPSSISTINGYPANRVFASSTRPTGSAITPAIPSQPPPNLAIENTRPFICEYNNCSKRYTTHSGLRRHHQQVHSKRFVCRERSCNLSFLTTATRDRHEAGTHERARMMREENQSMLTHAEVPSNAVAPQPQRSVHGDPPFSPEMKQMRLEILLEMQHIQDRAQGIAKKVQAIVNGKYQCTKCTFATVFKCEIWRHLADHRTTYFQAKGIKNLTIPTEYHVCYICGFTASRNVRMLAHVKLYHPTFDFRTMLANTVNASILGGCVDETKTAPLACTKCDFSTYAEHAMHNHRILLHRDVERKGMMAIGELINTPAEKKIPVTDNILAMEADSMMKDILAAMTDESTMETVSTTEEISAIEILAAMKNTLVMDETRMVEDIPVKEEAALEDELMEEEDTTANEEEIMEEDNLSVKIEEDYEVYRWIDQ